MVETVLPSLRPNARDLTLNINFHHIWYHHGLNVRCIDPFASYFAHGLLSDSALLHLTQLAWSQGLEVHRCTVNGAPESKRIFFVGVPMGWSVDGMVCYHLLTHFQLGEDSKDGSSWEALACHQMWPIR